MGALCNRGDARRAARTVAAEAFEEEPAYDEALSDVVFAKAGPVGRGSRRPSAPV